MKSLRAVRCLLAAVVLCLSCPLLAAIQLVPVVSSGLSSPVFVGNAGDGTNRLFIVEQGGVIRVLHGRGVKSATAATIRRGIQALDPPNEIGLPRWSNLDMVCSQSRQCRPRRLALWKAASAPIVHIS